MWLGQWTKLSLQTEVCQLPPIGHLVPVPVELTLLLHNLDKRRSLCEWTGGGGVVVGWWIVAEQVGGIHFPLNVMLSATSAQQLPEQGHPAAVPMFGAGFRQGCLSPSETCP